MRILDVQDSLQEIICFYLNHLQRHKFAKTCQTLHREVKIYYAKLTEFIQHVQHDETTILILWRQKFFDMREVFEWDLWCRRVSNQQFYDENHFRPDFYPTLTDAGFRLADHFTQDLFMNTTEETTLHKNEQIILSIKRFLVWILDDLMRAKDCFITHLMLEVILKQKLNVLLRYGDDAENLLFVAAKCDNRTAIDKLLQIGSGPEANPWVVQELLHTTDSNNQFPYNVAKDPEIAAKLYPSSIPPEVLILGNSLAAARQLEQRKPYIWSRLLQYEDISFPGPLSETASDLKEPVQTHNFGAFAGILLNMDQDKRLPLLKSVVLQLLKASAIDIVNENLLVTLEEMVTHLNHQDQMLYPEENDRFLYADDCIQTLKFAFTMQCDSYDDDQFGSIWMICIGTSDLDCFQFLKQMADIIYAGDENYMQIFMETHMPMTLLDLALQTFNDDVVQYVLSLNLPIIYDQDEIPNYNWEPGQQYIIKNCRRIRTMNGRHFYRIERINPWTPISKCILRGNTGALQRVIEKFLQIQMKNLEDGTDLDKAYTPYQICCKQTYDQLLDDETLNNAKFSEDEFNLNNWCQFYHNFPQLPNFEHFETHNKNDPENREKMKDILRQWEIEYERNIANARC
jgi:hypothetical protein